MTARMESGSLDAMLFMDCPEPMEASYLKSPVNTRAAMPRDHRNKDLKLAFISLKKIFTYHHFLKQY